jgi:hypothetical protein
MAKLPRILDRTGPFSGLGIACWIVGLVFVVAILLSPNGWGWWLDVHSVQGSEVDGLVYYSVHGANFTLSDPKSLGGGPRRQRTVYYLSSQPSDGSLSNTSTEVLDWGLTVGFGAAGLALLAVGFAMRARRNRLAKLRNPDSFGQGIPSDTIKAILDRNRYPRT